MNLDRTDLNRRTLFAASLALAAGSAWPQGYPSKVIKLVVPYPAGGATDVLARIVAESMSKRLQQTVIVENQPGANGMVGTEFVRRAPPDGYTLLFTLTSIVQNPLLYSRASYDPFKDFVPVSEVARMPIVLAANGSMGISTLNDLVKLARAKPGHYSYASYGNGSSAHMYMEIFQDQAKIELLHVPYKGESPAMTDLLGGQVHVAFLSAKGLGPHLPSGKVKAIAAVGTARAPLMNDVPTFKEQGFAEMESVGFFGLYAPAGTPAAAVTTVSQSVANAMTDVDVARKVGELGAVPKGLGPAELTAAMKADYERWGRVIKAKNIKID